MFANDRVTDSSRPATAPAARVEDAAISMREPVLVLRELRCEAHGPINVLPTYAAMDTVLSVASDNLSTKLTGSAQKTLDASAEFWASRTKGFAFDVPDRYCPKFLNADKPKDLLEGVRRVADHLESIPKEEFFPLFARGVLTAEDLKFVQFTLTQADGSSIVIRPLKTLGTGGQGTVAVVEVEKQIGGETYTDVMAMKCFRHPKHGEIEAENMIRGASISPLVPPVIDAFKAPGVEAIILMPYIQGETLFNYTARTLSGGSSLPELVSVVRQIVEGGRGLAELGLLPWDAHTGNIVIQSGPADPIVRFIDFGGNGSDTSQMMESTRTSLRRIHEGIPNASSIQVYSDLVESGISEFCARIERLWQKPDITDSEILARVSAVEAFLGRHGMSPSDAFDRAGLPLLD